MSECTKDTISLCHSSLQHASTDVERLLVGNKCDLESIREIECSKGQQVSSASCDPTGYHGIIKDGRGTEHELYRNKCKN